LLSLFHGFPPLSRTEHISKYSSIENFMKLPFQHVVIHQETRFKQGSYVRFTSALRAVQNWFQDVLHSVIRA
jgi:hypothetical protein